MVTPEAIVWVVLTYRLPREPSTPRIAVWRKLRRLGVVQVGDGVVAVPRDARTQEQLEWLADEIAEAGGTSLLWRAQLTSGIEQRRLTAELCQAREAEYDAVRLRAEEAVRLPSVERVRVLRSVKSELRRVQRRDYFPPAARDAAEAAVNVLGQLVAGEGVRSESVVSR